MMLQGDLQNLCICLSQRSDNMLMFAILWGKMFTQLAQFYFRGEETVLGDAASPNQVFLVDECSDVPISRIIGKVKVEFKRFTPSWFNEGTKSK